MDSTPPEVASYDAELQHQLQVLRSVAGASSVKDYPPGRLTSYNLNKSGVQLKLNLDGQTRSLNVHCSAERPTKLEAALVAKAKVKSLVGAAAMEAAEAAAEGLRAGGGQHQQHIVTRHVETRQSRRRRRSGWHHGMRGRRSLTKSPARWQTPLWLRTDRLVMAGRRRKSCSKPSGFAWAQLAQ
ncbi:hypothetical protein AB1Y20_010021 [Prymnesium parvum]|uniref:Uncharacterized protein n=1 Tax=Prymnesium parvum TaxID=97485 RepID=A0AB34K7Q2_PRYPA|mmetsp:Transcript_32848/g.81799  ORF Transcript_32848/g.81799 Transcript_32848/m.81799 type:complete len:184 (+) Transcript_32848:221-772(+)